MNIDKNNLDHTFFEYVDQIKILISPEIWENVLLDCSKNEILILLLLYRTPEVSMTQIAEYISVPLNTATGIISRMEGKQMVCRERSMEDKRVVTIALANTGMKQIQSILKEFIYYGQRVLETLSAQEIELAGNILDKVIRVLRDERSKTADVPVKKVKKIVIE